jgi:repressor LexA
LETIKDFDVILIGQRIKSERERQELTQGFIADKIGVVTSTIQRYETGNIKKIKIPVINAIASVLGVNPSWLLGLKVEKDIHSNSATNRADRIKEDGSVYAIPNSEQAKIKIYGKVPAGVPVEAIEDVVGEESIPREWLSGEREYIALRVSGDSMYPKYLDGDIVIIKLQPDCESGQDAVVYVNGYDATLKTVIKQDDGMIRLQPANPEFQPKTFHPKDITILGVVKRLRRDF